MSDPKRIEIVDCEMARKSEVFANCVPGTQHDILETPEDINVNNDGLVGVWVMGVTTPVKILEGEYVEI